MFKWTKSSLGAVDLRETDMRKTDLRKTNLGNTVLIKTDLKSYQKGDIISISGESNLSFGNSITISINNSKNELVWSEQANVKTNGQFSTLTFAGGPGWEQFGTFTIVAESDSEKTSNTFSFSE